MSAAFRRAKIVCTIGPATEDRSVFRQLVEAGMDAVRLNFSHTSHEEAAAVVSMTRDAVREHGRPIAIIGDLQGPRIRVGDLEEPLEVLRDEAYCFSPEGAPDAGFAADRTIPTTYENLARDVSPDDRILLDDGRLELTVTEVRDPHVIAIARFGGALGSQKGMNLPGVTVGAPSLSEKDLDDLEFARTQRLDYIALSFVRRPEDAVAAREKIGDSGMLLISKIEKDQALERLEEIIVESDAVMVARGDLGVELPYEEVPMAQKRIILRAQEQARPVITATQMLDSMRLSPRPTRAEVSDVANALLDGTDSVMLSAETAIGEHPVEVVKTMDRIIKRIELERPAKFARAIRRTGQLAEVQHSTSGAVAAAALEAVERLGSPFIVTFTRSGYTARVVAAQRPPVPVLAISDQWRTYNQLALAWGVRPILFRGEVSYASMLDRAREVALELGFGQPGDRIVVTAGVPFHVTGTTNMMRVEEL